MRQAKQFYGYLKKDTLLLVKRKKYLYLSIALPIIIASLFLLILNPSTGGIKVGVCDFDNSVESMSAIQNLKGFEAISLDKKDCIKNLQEAILKSEYPLGIEIEKGFSEKIENLEQANLVLYYDNTDIAFAQLMSWKVDQSIWPFKRAIIDELNKEMKGNLEGLREGVDFVKEIPESRFIQKRVDKMDSDLKKIESVDTEFLTNPIWATHKPINADKTVKSVGITFVFPIIALFILLMLASTSIIYDKNTNFLTRVKSSTNPIIYLVAKLTFFIGLTIIQFGLILALFIIFGASLNISIAGIINLILFIGVINTLIGFIIGLISDNEGIAILFSLILSFPLMLLSGIFTPLQTMPGFTQSIAKVLPLSHQINAAKTSLLFGLNFSYNWIYFGIGLLIASYILLQKKQ